jgi:hypothetical protein
MVLKGARAGSFLSYFVLPALLAQHAIWPQFNILPMLIYTLPGLSVLHSDCRHYCWLALAFYHEREQHLYSWSLMNCS